MGEKREIVCRYVGKGLAVSVATSIAGIKRSTYYYTGNGRPKGKQPSTFTYNCLIGNVSNDMLVNKIIDLIAPEYNDYGYQTVTELLKQQGYVINHKKVRRIMRDNNLLHPKVLKSNPLNKEFVKFTVPPLEGPFKTIEADIKYVYIHGANRNAFLVSFLCTFCRCNLVWELNYTMNSIQIINLLHQLLNHPIVKEYVDLQTVIIKIRTDNGPQFIAKKLAQALKTLGIAHEFIKPGTPQQNAHIEAFHSTITRLVCNRNIFEDLEHAIRIFCDFFYAYNYTRAMKSLLYYPPVEFLKLWKSGIVGIKKDKKNREIFFFREKPAPKLVTGLSAEVLEGINKSNTFEPRNLTTKKNSPVL
jgi:putative transposase